MLFQSAETIVDVFDRYDLKDSIKSTEKERRSQAAGGHRIYHVNEGSSILDWTKFLSNNRNKQELISFLGEFISKMGPIGKESSFSTVISSLHVVSANARRNTSSGLMFPCTVSPDRHFSFVFLFISENVLMTFSKTLLN
jgi:hypothetical protein